MQSKVSQVVIPLNLLFKVLAMRKEEIPAFRLWFVMRYLLDKEKTGRVEINTLAEWTGMTAEYLRKICNGSLFFKSVSRTTIYYAGQKSVMRRLRLQFSVGIWRGEKVTGEFLKNLHSVKRFKSFIVKCYLQKDRRKKVRSLTNGRISWQDAADELRISRKTVYACLKTAKAKSYTNIRWYPKVRFKKKTEFRNWLLNNLETRVDDQIGDSIEKSPSSYFPAARSNGFILARRLPNIYRFSGSFQTVKRRKKRGTSS